MAPTRCVSAGTFLDPPGKARRAPPCGILAQVRPLDRFPSSRQQTAALTAVCPAQVHQHACQQEHQPRRPGVSRLSKRAPTSQNSGSTPLPGDGTPRDSHVTPLECPQSRQETGPARAPAAWQSDTPKNKVRALWLLINMQFPQAICTRWGRQGGEEERKKEGGQRWGRRTGERGAPLPAASEDHHSPSHPMSLPLRPLCGRRVCRERAQRTRLRPMPFL